MNPTFQSPMQQGPIPNPYLNNYAPMSAQTPFYSQPIFQPAGMVFLINSPQELHTIPNQAGLNLYWCANESKIYIRNCTNGAVETKEYYISTTPNNSNSNMNGGAQVAGIDAIEDIPTELFNKLDTRLSSIERHLKNLKGGDPEWQL